MKDMTPPKKRFRIAFSFTGDKRYYVAKVAQILADKFGRDKILYDKYHQAEFARNDLGIYLPELYNKETDLLVLVLCNKYDEKEWTGLEWLAIHDVLQQKRREEVFLSRFEHAQVQGLYRGAGYIELEEHTPEEFASLILERLALNEDKLIDNYKQTATAPKYVEPHTNVKHNLPTIQPFFGREEELQKIAEALEPENRIWGALIEGHGGMGKTSLAVRAAYNVPADTFDRIIFISLKSRELDDSGERDLSGFIITGLQELFNELALELGRAEIAQAVMEQRPRLLLDALRSTRALLVLDNLESLTKTERDTLFTFVKRLPEGCKAIFTLRGRIGSGAEELLLEHLDEPAAMATLAELATHNKKLEQTTEAERLQLYKATGGNPLLLRWTAGQIGRGQCLNIRHAIDFLKSCPEGNDPLAFIFGDLVQDFTDVETKALCALTYFTLPAKAEHIANLAEYDADEIEKALRTLVNRSLVVPSKELQTFTLVPLVADFLHRHRPEVLVETGNRLEKYVYALVTENGYDKHECIPILEDAWPAIAAGLPGLLGGENSRLQEVCNALVSFLNFAGCWDEWIALCIEAEKRAVTARDMKNAGRRAYNAGCVHYLRGQSDEVIHCADRAEKYWQEPGAVDKEKSSAFNLRGMGYELAENYHRAIDAYKEAVALDRKLNPVSIDVAISLNDLANAEHRSGDYDAAERDYNEALRIAKVVAHQEGIINMIGNLGALALDKNDWSKAESLAKEALLLCEEVGRRELIAINYYTLATALVMQGKKEEGLPYARLAVDIFTRLGSPKLANAEETLKMCGG